MQCLATRNVCNGFLSISISKLVLVKLSFPLFWRKNQILNFKLGTLRLTQAIIALGWMNKIASPPLYIQALLISSFHTIVFHFCGDHTFEREKWWRKGEQFLMYFFQSTYFIYFPSIYFSPLCCMQCRVIIFPLSKQFAPHNIHTTLSCTKSDGYRINGYLGLDLAIIGVHRKEYRS